MHWLDDAFDSLGYGRLTDDERLPIAFDIKNVNTEAVAEYYHPYGIRRVLLEIKARTRWTEGSEMGLMRIVCGGFIQGLAGRHRANAVSRVRTDILQAVTDIELRDLVRQANTGFLWGITKSDMPLVVSMYVTGDFHLHAASVVLDSLFMPLLVWHDLDTELLRESVPKDGFEGNGIKVELNDAVGLAMQCIDVGRRQGFQENAVIKAMLPVLKLVFHQYEPRLPKTGNYENYRQALGTWLSEK